MIVILMGVSGSGKSTVGEALAAALGWPFFDGDDFQPPENIARMAAGEPLDDASRAAWLSALRSLIEARLAAGQNGIIAASSLKRRYRRQLRGDSGDALRFVYLQGSRALIRERMAARRHFFGPDMLESQFAALEEPGPDEALVVSIDQSVDSIVHDIIRGLALK